MKLLSTRNAKIDKSNKSGFIMGAIMHLAPHKLSGHQVCASASAGCIKACLNTAGYGVYSNVQNARINKTKLFFDDRPAFITQLKKEIAAFVRKCKKLGKLAAIRLNGTSDLPWEKLCPELFTEFPMVQFYDYTKIYSRMLKWCEGELPHNYHLTFSKSENNWDKCLKVLRAGGNVAAVFHYTVKGAYAPGNFAIPKTYKGFDVVNGDADDFTFTRKTGTIFGLLAKGQAKKDTSGFTIVL